MTQDPSPQRPREEAIHEAIGVHRDEMDRIASEADADTVKRSYVELGGLLDEAVGSDVEATPVLSYAENAAALARLFGALQGRILDAGCGPNPVHTLRLGADASRTLVALDIGHGMVRIARDIAAKQGITIHAVVGDVEALPFRDGVFDGCVCADTIEHLPDDAAGVGELARTLRRGGRLVLATPNRTRLDVILNRLLDRRRGIKREPKHYFASTSHLREYTWGDLRRLVAPHFRIRGWTSVGWDGGLRAKLATIFVAWKATRGASRMVVYDLEPRK